MAYYYEYRTIKRYNMTTKHSEVKRNKRGEPKAEARERKWWDEVKAIPVKIKE